jgi:hypothetical protein
MTITKQKQKSHRVQIVISTVIVAEDFVINFDLKRKLRPVGGKVLFCHPHPRLLLTRVFDALDVLNALDGRALKFLSLWHFGTLPFFRCNVRRKLMRSASLWRPRINRVSNNERVLHALLNYSHKCGLVKVLQRLGPYNDHVPHLVFTANWVGLKQITIKLQCGFDLGGVRQHGSSIVVGVPGAPIVSGVHGAREDARVGVDTRAASSATSFSNSN